ncbi:hypothetical protein CAEBREN_17351 [Caenorhabditis brenneri]|uniref:Uncharacterized protein n=1 Tax=Caenorhabditis brenneri TaxID=135651 RepID=G0MUY7_CAEBE|nr:hypothetical protein CAEBREN_17351 [Caenorhabditis brenneri]
MSQYLGDDFAQKVLMGDYVLREQEKQFRACGMTGDQFLDYLNQNDPIHDAAAIDILKVCQNLAATVTQRRVERSLILKTGIPLLKKWKIGKKYKLEKLKAHCLKEGKKEEDKLHETFQRLLKSGKLIGWDDCDLKKKEEKPERTKKDEIKGTSPIRTLEDIVKAFGPEPPVTTH